MTGSPSRSVRREESRRHEPSPRLLLRPEEATRPQQYQGDREDLMTPISGFPVSGAQGAFS